LKDKSALYWLLFLGGFPIILFYTLSYLFEPSRNICWISILPGPLIFVLWSLFGHVFRKPTKKLDWDETESVGETTERKASEKYSVEERSTKKDEGLLARVFGKKKRCETCGSELVYKSGAGSYYCTKCQEYKWE